MLTCDSPNLIQQSMNFQRMMKQCIEHAFDQADLRFKPEKAMLVNFRMNDGGCVQLALWTEGNYVGVFSRHVEAKGNVFGKINGNWQVHCYHDSCWRESFHDFLREIEEEVWGFWFSPWTIVNVDVEQQKVFKRIIKERYD